MIADPDRRRAALRVLVAQPKRRHHSGFLLELREADPFAFALTRAGVRPGGQRPTAVHGGFFEHLLAYLGPPRQPGHHHLGDPIGVHGQHPARVLGFLPHVEPVDQIKPRPRHVDTWIARFAEERDENGRRLVVRNGRHEPREVTTCAGVIEMHAPRVNDRRVDPDTAERQRFSSAILPPWARKTPQIEQVLPLLYLHGLSSGDFVPALGQFLSLIHI